MAQIGVEVKTVALAEIQARAEGVGRGAGEAVTAQIKPAAGVAAETKVVVGIAGPGPQAAFFRARHFLGSVLI